MGEEPGSMTPRIRSEEEVASAPDDPTQLRAEIAQTRAEMSETIDAIQERLSPQHLMQEAKDSVRDATVGKVKDMMSSATDKAADLAEDVQDGAREAVVYVKQNPIPAVMIGAGIAWMLLRPSTRERGSSYSRGRTSGGAARAREVYDDDRYGEPGRKPLAYRTTPYRETGPGMTERLQQGWQEYSHRAENQFDRWMRQSPLAVGAVAMAVGAAVGLSAPGTDTENEWLGDTRDTLVERAQEAAKDTVAQATQAVESVGQAMEGMTQGNEQTPQSQKSEGRRTAGGAGA